MIGVQQQEPHRADSMASVKLTVKYLRARSSFG